MGRRYVHAAVGIAALVLAAGLARAADAAVGVITPRAGVLNLRTGDVDTRTLPNLLGADGFDATPCVLVLDGPMDPARATILANAGVRLLGYLPWHAYICELRDANPAALRAAGFVTWIGAYQREWKIEPQLLNAARVPTTPERQALADAGKAAVTIHLFAHRDPAAVQAALANLDGASVSSVERVGDSIAIGAILPRVAIPALADLDDVQFVEEFPEYTLRSNSTTRWVVQSNLAGITPLYDRGLTGQGQIVGVIDGRIAPAHCSFLDSVNPIGPDHRKILAYNTSVGYNAHGTHVAGTVAGDGGTWSDTRGIAYNAKLVYNIHPTADETSMYARFELHAQQGATVHTNSWGADWTREYDGGCRGIDRAARDFEDILILHAVSDGSIVTNPENAKNSLAVTASSQAPNQANWCFGGNGPTQDGRRKPEIAAPGCAIFSSNGSTGCATAGFSGTSMACPAVAGVAVLARQYFTSGFYPSGIANTADAFSPSGQLLKALLVNSAADMTGVAGFPSDREGWGRVLADDALYFAGDARRLIVTDVRNSSPGALVTGGLARTRVAVLPGQSLKITLAWADEPAQVNATYVPINNLNLRVTSPGGAVYFGNVFAGGVSSTGGTPDALNNLEQVLLASPESGTWSVDVVGAEVNIGTQGFALVITGGVTPFACDPDVNCDGAANGVDVEVQELAVGGDFADYCASDADFNGDGAVNGLDVEALELVVAGGPCP
ncbi:MAG: hypothetical protein HBSAPP03_13720 [Phycisphaerae bacterium]|nr:MAG: hypothetical protein HBSAPP03_13720 [Phycisphaerae bacterium]